MFAGCSATTSTELYKYSTEAKQLHDIFPPQPPVLLFVHWNSSTLIFIKGHSLITP